MHHVPVDPGHGQPVRIEVALLTRERVSDHDPIAGLVARGGAHPCPPLSACGPYPRHVTADVVLSERPARETARAGRPGREDGAAKCVGPALTGEVRGR